MIMWFCFHCRTALPGIKGVYKSVKKLESKHTNLEYRQGILEDRVTKLEELESRVDKLENDESKAGLKGEDKIKNQGEVVQVATEVAKEIMEEYKEKERRKLHVVFQNLPESVNDNEEVQKIMREIGILTAVNDTERVGVKREGQHRTLRMCCKSFEEKKDILGAARKLRDSDNETLKNVYIRPDLTKKEREEAYLRREELRARRREGGTWIIRRNRVVQINAATGKEIEIITAKNGPYAPFRDGQNN